MGRRQTSSGFLQEMYGLEDRLHCHLMFVSKVTPSDIAHVLFNGIYIAFCQRTVAITKLLRYPKCKNRCGF